MFDWFDVSDYCFGFCFDYFICVIVLLVSFGLAMYLWFAGCLFVAIYWF